MPLQMGVAGAHQPSAAPGRFRQSAGGPLRASRAGLNKNPLRRVDGRLKTTSALQLPVMRSQPAHPLFGTRSEVAALRPIVRVLGGIVCAGVVLRAQGLFRYPLEQDELYTVQEATQLWSTTLQPGIAARPLYFLFQRVLLEVLPGGAVWLRLPAFVLGLLGIWLTWRIAKTLFGALGGWSAAALIALSPWHLYVSGMARYWSALYALSAGFVYLLLRAGETGERKYYLGALALL